jgi:hypothetical protein
MAPVERDNVVSLVRPSVRNAAMLGPFRAARRDLRVSSMAHARTHPPPIDTKDWTKGTTEGYQ